MIGAITADVTARTGDGPLLAYCGCHDRGARESIKKRKINGLIDIRLVYFS